MAIKITSFGGTDWVSGDVLNAADLIETIEFTKENKVVISLPQLDTLSTNVFTIVATGSATNDIDSQMYRMNSGTTINSTNQILYKTSQADTDNFIFNNNPVFSCYIRPDINVGEDSEKIAIVGDSTIDKTNVTNHMGFVIEVVAGTGTLFATNGNGSTQTTDDTSVTLVGNDNYLLQAVMNSGIDIKFFVDGLLVSTSTTNLPSGSLPNTKTFNFSHILNDTTSTSYNVKTAMLSYDVNDNT